MRASKHALWSATLHALRALPAIALLSAFSPDASARPGTHPIVVSAWDARASSVVLEYRHASFSGGGMNVVSYHANFSSTGGKLSSQFGLYYLNMSESGMPTAQGLAGSAAAVFNLPVTRRFDNGLPVVAIDFYVGSAPTALISGERNYLTLPLTIGFGVPVTPAKALSITPWFEFAPSFNLDTVIHPFDFSQEDPTKYIVNGEIKLTSNDVERVIAKSVDLQTSAAVGARGGLDLALHASDSFDFDLNATISSLGTAFAGPTVVYLGGGFIWRWDDIVPAVLPAEKRLLHESCDDVEQRFKSCPNSKKWRSPEEVERLYGPQNAAPAAAPTTPSPSSNPPPSAAPIPDAAPAAPAPSAPADPAPETSANDSAAQGVSGAFPAQP
jgi:hypothetical protein